MSNAMRTAPYSLRFFPILAAVICFGCGKPAQEQEPDVPVVRDALYGKAIFQGQWSAVSNIRYVISHAVGFAPVVTVPSNEMSRAEIFNVKIKGRTLEFDQRSVAWSTNSTGEPCVSSVTQHMALSVAINDPSLGMLSAGATNGLRARTEILTRISCETGDTHDSR